MAFGSPTTSHPCGDHLSVTVIGPDTYPHGDPDFPLESETIREFEESMGTPVRGDGHRIGDRTRGERPSVMKSPMASQPAVRQDET